MIPARLARTLLPSSPDSPSMGSASQTRAGSLQPCTGAPESPRVWPPNTRGDCWLPSGAHLPARPAWHRQEQDHCCWETAWGGNAGQTLTCLLNKRCSNPFLGCGEGCPFQSRSGGTVPSVLKTFSSLKHSVSIIWKREKKLQQLPRGAHHQGPAEHDSSGDSMGTLPSARVGTRRGKDLPRSAKEWAHSL